MDAEQGAPYVDLQELSRYIADRTGIPAEVVARVLQAESEYLIERGIARRSSDGAEHEIPGIPTSVLLRLPPNCRAGLSPIDPAQKAAGLRCGPATRRSTRSRLDFP
jgi:hypothetical protein